MINIGGQDDDNSYRYKMPSLKAKKEGRGNGVKTAFLNITEISKSLHIDPIYPSKFLGIELGAHSSFNKKNDRCVINGHHTTETLQELLIQFIDKFILCDRCNLPETMILVDKRREKVIKKCAACGIKTRVDPLHKLTTFIAKKPPSYKKGAFKRKGKRHAEVKQEEKSQHSEEVKGDANSSDELTKGPTKEAEDSEDGVWDIPAATPRLDQKEEVNGDKNASILHDMLRGGASANELLAEVGRMELASPAGKLAIFQSVVEALFHKIPADKAAEEIERQRGFLAELAAQDKRNEGNLLDAFEDYVSHKRTSFVKASPYLLKKLYDCDALSEKAILDWEGRGDSGNEAKKNCAVFVNWLREAEEESSE